MDGGRRCNEGAGKRELQEVISARVQREDGSVGLGDHGLEGRAQPAPRDLFQRGAEIDAAHPRRRGHVREAFHDVAVWRDELHDALPVKHNGAEAITTCALGGVAVGPARKTLLLRCDPRSYCKLRKVPRLCHSLGLARVGGVDTPPLSAKYSSAGTPPAIDQARHDCCRCLVPAPSSSLATPDLRPACDGRA